MTVDVGGVRDGGVESGIGRVGVDSGVGCVVDAYSVRSVSGGGAGSNI